MQADTVLKCREIDLKQCFSIIQYGCIHACESRCYFSLPVTTCAGANARKLIWLM